MNKATFLITTPRSGTQWLTDSLKRYYADLMVAEHEPIGYAYRPKVYLREEHRLDELRALPKVSEHLDNIHRILESKSYVEAGFPCYALAPLLVREFGQRLRLVNLIRNPVSVAISVTTHHWYEPTRRDRLPFDVQLDPSDSGVIQKQYGDRWHELSTYEKALFYWTEVHLFALEVRGRYPDVPFHTVKFEEMLSSPSELEALATFLEVPYRAEWEKSVGIPVDRFREKPLISVDWTEVFQHEQIVALASRFGYDLTGVNGRDFWSHFQASRRSGILRRIQGGIKKGLRLLREPGRR